MGPWVPGGRPSPPRFLMAARCHGLRSARHSEGTIYLAQYDSHHIDTDAKKTTLFHTELCVKIYEHLMPFRSWMFNQLMSVAIQ
jgi:hypothetical protein